MSKIKLGDKVRILDNAYEGSDKPDDFAARGKIGVVVWVFDDDCVEVRTEPDDEFYPLTIDEVEIVEADEE
jgi:hypothetical protein